MFVLSFIFLILDLENYQKEKNEDSKRTYIPKRSRYALLFGLLALVTSVILSIAYT
ncbi:MAG: hypothetical protein R3255_00655 [Candidatus Lokiarchaeia archaeon]|nr:hypothetical protein [Candidatus Lokiarchaeia archaeon]